MLERCDDQAEAVFAGAPGVRFVLERQVVAARVQSAHRLLRVATGEIRLKTGRDSAGTSPASFIPVRLDFEVVRGAKCTFIVMIT